MHRGEKEVVVVGGGGERAMHEIENREHSAYSLGSGK